MNLAADYLQLPWRWHDVPGLRFCLLLQHRAACCTASLRFYTQDRGLWLGVQVCGLPERDLNSDRFQTNYSFFDAFFPTPLSRLSQLLRDAADGSVTKSRNEYNEMISCGRKCVFSLVLEHNPSEGRKITVPQRAREHNLRRPQWTEKQNRQSTITSRPWCFTICLSFAPPTSAKKIIKLQTTNL